MRKLFQNLLVWLIYSVVFYLVTAVIYNQPFDFHCVHIILAVLLGFFASLLNTNYRLLVQVLDRLKDTKYIVAVDSPTDKEPEEEPAVDHELTWSTFWHRYLWCPMYGHKRHDFPLKKHRSKYCYKCGKHIRNW